MKFRDKFYRSGGVTLIVTLLHRTKTRELVLAIGQVLFSLSFHRECNQVRFLLLVHLSFTSLMGICSSNLLLKFFSPKVIYYFYFYETTGDEGCGHYEGHPLLPHH